MDRRNPLEEELAGACFVSRREAAGQAGRDAGVRDYVMLGLDDIFLDYAGQHDAGHPVHAALAAVQPGDRLAMQWHDVRPVLVNGAGIMVAQLSAKAAETWKGRQAEIKQVNVIGLLARTREDCRESEYQARLRVDQWEIPLCELALGGAEG